jgi:thymidylate kinase
MLAGSPINRTRFVSFSGIDGAGKSTQIAALCARLCEAGLRVRVITFWDEIATLTRLREGAGHTLFRGDKGVGSPSRPINRRDKNVRSWPMSCVRLGMYFLDALSARRVVKKALRSGYDFIVFDRFVYDELANLNLGNPLMRAYARLLLALVPRPDISYLLDADPVKARARKPEYPLDFLHTNRQAYLQLNALSGALTVIAPMSVEDAKREVLHHALKMLSLGASETQSGSAEQRSEHRGGSAELNGPHTHPAAS